VIFHRGFQLLLLLCALFGPLVTWVLVDSGGAASGAAFGLVVALSCAVLLGADLIGKLGRARLQILGPLAALCVALGTPAYYGLTGQVIRARKLPHLDPEFRLLDERLLGWLFPGGEVAVWLDRHAWFGPATWTGKALTEVFQLFYFSYYFWGYLLLIWLMVRVFRSVSALGADGLAARFRSLQDFLCAWAGAYFLNFICYILFPVIGPKFFSPQTFVNPVDGFGLARMIQDFIVSQQAVQEDCFPSGHTALSWVTGFAALRLAPRYARLALPAAMIITGATIYLRYHYVVDLLGALPLVLVALAWGGFLPGISAGMRGNAASRTQT
jgi:hypothetical protein